jgi:hypothetical protein
VYKLTHREKNPSSICFFTKIKIKKKWKQGVYYLVIFFR